MTKSCPQCQCSFTISPSEDDFRRSISPQFSGRTFLIPEPSLCPDCRQQRRLAFRNELNLYKRTCDKCKKSIISVYSSDKPLVVYCSDCWWGDARPAVRSGGASKAGSETKHSEARIAQAIVAEESAVPSGGDSWNALSYGQNFDFTKPFFPQFQELTKKVPLLANSVFNSQNCEFNSFAVDNKDCYLSARIASCEKVLYSYLVIQGRDSVDCMNLFQSEGCYECIDCWNGYNLMFCQLCKNSSDSYFCYDCIGVKNCFGCIGLRNKEYHFFNKPCSKEDYERYVKQYFNGSSDQMKKIREKFYQEVIVKNPHRATYQLNSENAIGDYITNSKDVVMGFDIEKSESITHTWGAEYAKDVLDGSFIYYGERCYEQVSNSHSSNILFSFNAINAVHDALYSIILCNNAGPAFGCISLNHQSHCILNKQYSKEDYERKMSEILEHMSVKGGSASGGKKTSEYGEFFPMELSLFAYNETVAQEYFPLSKEEVLKRGLRWKDPEDNVTEGMDTKKLPDNISEVKDDVLSQTLICAATARPYKITAQELEFYRKKNLPLPRLHPLERKRQRMLLRNPRKLWQRTCAAPAGGQVKCQKPITTSYSPERPEKVYCEVCYLQQVYG